MSEEEVLAAAAHALLFSLSLSGCHKELSDGFEVKFGHGHNLPPRSGRLPSEEERWSLSSGYTRLKVIHTHSHSPVSVFNLHIETLSQIWCSATLFLSCNKLCLLSFHTVWSSSPFLGRCFKTMSYFGSSPFMTRSRSSYGSFSNLPRTGITGSSAGSSWTATGGSSSYLSPTSAYGRSTYDRGGCSSPSRSSPYDSALSLRSHSTNSLNDLSSAHGSSSSFAYQPTASTYTSPYSSSLAYGGSSLSRPYTSGNSFRRSSLTTRGKRGTSCDRLSSSSFSLPSTSLTATTPLISNYVCTLSLVQSHNSYN